MRVGVYVLVPVILAVAIATVIGALTQRHQLWDLDRGRKLIREQSQHLKEVSRLVKERSDALRIARHRESVANERSVTHCHSFIGGGIEWWSILGCWSLARPLYPQQQQQLLLLLLLLHPQQQLLLLLLAVPL